MKKVLFFISSLYSGGKERRLIELISYLKKLSTYEILMVSIYDGTGYPKLLELQIDWRVLNQGLDISNHRPNSDFIKMSFNFQQISPFWKIQKLVKEFNPDIVHTWGRTETFYVLPSVVFYNITLVNSQITSAPPKISRINRWINAVNFRFSNMILSNSQAGIEAYRPPKSKTRVIYNGMSMDRFQNLPDPNQIKCKYNIQTDFAVVMVATLSKNKNQILFFQVGQYITKMRSDITFLSVGFHEGEKDGFYCDCLNLINNNPLLKVIAEVKEVESLVNACDIGMLFSNQKEHGEGVSNAILEYMALGKPVIANDAGGTREIVKSGQNGYLIQNESVAQISDLIIGLVDNPSMRTKFGSQGKKLVQANFTLEKMGESFAAVYNEISKPSAEIDFFPVT